MVRTGFQHNDMRDTGPDEAKESIEGMLDKFLDDDSPLQAGRDQNAAADDRCRARWRLRPVKN